jgi:hypothetical protein
MENENTTEYLAKLAQENAERAASRAKVAEEVAEEYARLKAEGYAANAKTRALAHDSVMMRRVDTTN